MNALIATFVAFKKCWKLNFISVTSSVPPIDEHDRGRVDECADRAAEHDRRPHDDERANEPD